MRPRLELRFGPFEIGAGGEFNYSEDENDIPPNLQPLTIIRDNYRSRDARLDLAYAKATLGPVTLYGGRFFMPIPLTEMIWDRDLRPQGGAATLTLGEAQSPARFAIHGIYSLGSHVFDDEGDFLAPDLLDEGATEMFGGAAELSLGRAGESALHVMGAYLQFDKLAMLEPVIRRQNTRVAGPDRRQVPRLRHRRPPDARRAGPAAAGVRLLLERREGRRTTRACGSPP